MVPWLGTTVLFAQEGTRALSGLFNLRKWGPMRHQTMGAVPVYSLEISRQISPFQESTIRMCSSFTIHSTWAKDHASVHPAPLCSVEQSTAAGDWIVIKKQRPVGETFSGFFVPFAHPNDEQARPASIHPPTCLCAAVTHPSAPLQTYTASKPHTGAQNRISHGNQLG